MSMSDVMESSDTVPTSLSSLPVPTLEPPCTPTALISSTSSTSPGHMTMSLASPRFVHPRFPVRVGISWVKGEKLEAMDFSRTWYPSKIVEIDETQKMVLIHFEGWNQRYDEWVPMDSDKLRPVTRHSERKDKGSKKRRIHPHPIYRAGEHVLAKWTDCKKYPAKIIRMMDDGSYEVNFFDGVSCLVQAMNIQPLPEEMKNKSPPYKSPPPSVKPKISFKSIKVSLPESVKKRVEQLSAEKKKHEFPDLEVTRKKAEQQTPESWKKTAELKAQDFVKKNVEQPSHSDILKRKLEQQTSDLKTKIQQVSEDLKKASEEVKISSLKRKLTPPKVYIKREPDKGSFSCHIRLSPLKAKRLKELKETKRVSLTLSTAEATTSKNFYQLEKEASSMGLEMTSSEVQTNLISDLQDEDKINKSLVDNLKESTVHSPILVDETELKTQPFLVDFSINTSPKGLSGHTSRKRSRKRSFFSTKKERLKNSKSSKVNACVTTKSPLFKTARAKSLDSGLIEVISTDSTFSAAPLPAAPVQKFVPSKAFIVEEDHNPFKCHFEGCTKAFRKETLLTSHIKYYHTDAETPTSSTAALSPLVQSPIHAPGSRKRRKKTNSICSTDSDISIGSREKLLISKRQRHDSEISITTASPDLINKDIWADTKNQRFPQDQDESVVVEYDEDFDKDIVNCICGHRETNGLMIQCDICMCWQHFACMDTNNTGEPPANYVCFICENPPGVRDSCKYLHDLSWEKKGELPSFPFNSEPPSENLKSLAMECHELSSVLHKLKAALHSARRQIKISKEEDEHEFQLWQTDWDNWTKPDEDLTLTPRSVDPDPSPTPSTFLFLSAPSGTLSQVCSAATISTSPPTCSAATSTSATIEVTTGLPSPASMPQSSSLDTRRDRISSGEDMSPPPSGCTAIPQTPSTSRGGSFLSFQGKVDSLVRDLFPGPGGDAEKLTLKGNGSRTLEETEVSAHREKSSINTLVNGDKNYPVKVNGDSLSTVSNQTIRELLPDSTITGAVSSPSRDSPVTSHDNNVDGEKLLSATLTNLSSNDLCRSDHTVNSSAEQSYKTSATSAMDNDDLLEGNRVKPLSELFVDVNGVQSHSTVYTDDQDNDTDTAEESVDPYKNCEHNLLVHVSKVQTNVEKHLELIEQQIAELENAEHNNVTVQLNEENILNDVPALKKSLSKVARNLYKVQRLCLHN